MLLEVDLHAPTVPRSQRVWRLFPGEHYQFLESFRDQAVGFLDFPGLELPPGGLLDAPDLIDRIARSKKIEELLRTAPGTDLDEIRLEQFAGARATPNRNRLRNALMNFYGEARDGDLVILPEPVYMSRVWVGQFVGNETVKGYYARYGRVPIPARSVRWLQHHPENMISAALSQALRHPHPFTLLERSLHLEVFALVYGSFVYGDRHTATVYNSTDFLDADAALLGAISRLAAAACQAIDEGTTLDAENLIDVLLNNPPIQYTCTQESDIHSAGFNRYISGSIVALVIATVAGSLIGFSQYSAKEGLEEDIQKLSIVNTGSNADPQCTARVSEAARRVLSVLGIDRTWALCEAARAAKERTGLRPTATPTKK